MGFIGNKPTAVPLTGSDLADDIITLAKMASGTDGNLITYDASGNPAAVAVGTSGQVLTSGGAGVAPTFATTAGGADTSLSNLTTAGQELTVDAWIGFVGTGTIAIVDSYNVSSITDNSVGNYTVNLSITMANAGYGGSASVSDVSWGAVGLMEQKTTTTFRVLVYTNITTGTGDSAQVTAVVTGSR